MASTNVSSQVLRNVGVPVQVAEIELKVEADQKVEIDPVSGIPQVVDTYRSMWVPKVDPTTNDFVTTTKFVKFTANTMAALEEKYGSIQEFHKFTETKANEATRVAIALSWGYHPDDDAALDKVGAMFLDSETGMYTSAVSIAMALASGVNPTQAAEMYEMTRVEVKEGMEKANEAMAEMVAKAKQDKIEEAAQEEAEALKAEQASEAVVETSIPTETESSLGTDGSETGSESDEPTPSSGS